MNQIETVLANYEQADAWLLSLIRDPLGRSFTQEKPKAERLQAYQQKLARLRHFLHHAGTPQQKYKTVHITGTSGKGSVTTMINALLQATGVRVGHHINPYLQLPLEKLMVNGRFTSPQAFAQHVTHFKELYETWLPKRGEHDGLRYGEVWVSLTYFYFAQEQVEWAVMEAGMGGRFDASNVVDSELAVITNVDYDHARTLGPALEDIAWHKAGIMKQGKMAVTAVRPSNLRAVLKQEAQAKQAKLYCLGEDWDYTLHKDQTVTVQTPHRTYERLVIGATGAYQRENAALAVTAVDLLQDQLPQPLHNVLRPALETVSYNGRMEIMQTEPLVILDGAHNPHKMQTLIHSLRQDYPHKRLILIIGALGYKFKAGLLQAVVGETAVFYATEPHVYGKKGMPASEMAEQIHAVDPDKPIHTFEQVADALQHAISYAQPDDLIVVTGSLYLVGEAREYWFPSAQMLQQLAEDG